ncbi:MAG: DoxX family protein [Roseivirga sp.]|nr:DoxX family protein [Roseivirga sp.]
MKLRQLHQFKATNLALVIIRLWLGTIMIKHSGSYLFGGKMPDLTGYLDSMSWPMPELMAYASQISELVAAIMIILGMRLGAILMAFTLSIAVIFAHGLAIYGEAELPFNYFVFALVLTLVGCGKPSLDNRLFK